MYSGSELRLGNLLIVQSSYCFLMALSMAQSIGASIIYLYYVPRVHKSAQMKDKHACREFISHFQHEEMF